MKRFFKTPHFFFLPASVLMAFIGFLIPPESFDLTIYDTSYIISNVFGFHLFAIIGFVMSWGYWTAFRNKRSLSYRLNAIHVTISALGPLSIWISSLFYRAVIPPTDNIVADLEHNTSVSMVIFSLALITLLVQLVYPVNIIRAVWKGKRKARD